MFFIYLIILFNFNSNILFLFFIFEKFLSLKFFLKVNIKKKLVNNILIYFFLKSISIFNFKF